MVTLFKKWFMVIIFLFIIMFFILLIKSPTADYENVIDKEQLYAIKSSEYENYVEGKWRKLDNDQIRKLSKLGEILYLERDPPVVNTTVKNYTILIWEHGPKLEARHIKLYSDKRFDPFEHCSVKNCKITYKSEDLKGADLVVFHLHRTHGVNELPLKSRNPHQIWTFLTDESPFHTFLYPNNNKLKDYNGLFNWSMTYRMNSDIPVPYGRAVALKMREKSVEEDLRIWNKNKKQNVLVAVMGSNCGGKNHRWKYVDELQKYILIDRYGNCGPLKCPGHFDKDCDLLSKYKFYLSFENSNCDEYITEKLWWNAYAKNVIPIVMGSSKDTYRQLLPPNSYINVDDFASPRDLANYISYINNTSSEIEKYFSWKKRFKILNEHGYFGSKSFHYCRICEALNYNNKANKVYTNLENVLSKDKCYPAWDEE